MDLLQFIRCTFHHHTNTHVILTFFVSFHLLSVPFHSLQPTFHLSKLVLFTPKRTQNHSVFVNMIVLVSLCESRPLSLASIVTIQFTQCVRKSKPKTETNVSTLPLRHFSCAHHSNTVTPHYYCYHFIYI